MSRSRRVRRWAVALAAATVLTACGGGGGGGGLGGGNVSAQQYVKSTCTSLGAWVRDVQKRVAAVSQQNPSTAAAGKKLITSFFDAVVADTGKLIDELKAGGTPDVDNGDQIQAAIVTTLEKAKSLLQQTRGRVENLPTDNPHAFVLAIESMSRAVQGAFQKAGQQFAHLRSPELEAAATKEPACKTIGA